MIDSKTKPSIALQSAGELTPAFGKLMKGLGLVLEKYNEKDIKKKYKEISNLIPSNMKNEISGFIALKLTIRKRKFLTKLTLEEVQK